MLPMNYCRQMTPALESAVRSMADRCDQKSIALRNEYVSAINMAREAKKFTLPLGGRVIVDFDLRGLGDIELRLPFNVIALEYSVDDDGKAQKHVVIAEEQDDRIIMQYVIGFTDGDWVPAGRVHIPRTNYAFDCGGYYYPAVVVEDPDTPEEFALEPAYAVISFLNALACANVGIEKIQARKENKSKKRTMGAIGFDEYHILTISVPVRAQRHGRGVIGGTDRRSPREHLRRGHIRQLSSGVRIWVNAAAVNAAKGFCSVFKDYSVLNS